MQCDTGEQREFSELREESHGEKMVLGCDVKNKWKLVKQIQEKEKCNRKENYGKKEYIGL